MNADLFPYQRAGAEWLASREAGLLADDMGLGKSPTAVAACDAAGVRTALVFCPGIARENWAREFRRWSIHPRRVEVVRCTDDLFTWRVQSAEITVCSYTLLTSKKARAWLAQYRVDALICDEAHALKNPEAVRTRAIYGHEFDRDPKVAVAGRARHVWLLTGTPILNDPSEVWTHFRALWPETLREVGVFHRRSFLDHFCLVDDLSGRIVGARRIPAFLKMVRPHVLRRLQSEVQADLPPLLWENYPVAPDTLPPMPPEVVEAKMIAEAAFARVRGDDTSLAAVQAEQMHLATLRRWTGIAKAQCVAELVAGDIAAGLGPVVVFALHREAMAAINAGVPGSRLLSGDTKPLDRQALIDDFQAGRIPALICQLSIASTALTLTRASEVVFAEASWVPADMMQAAKRCHRIGQGAPVRARIVSLAGSIDEDVADVLVRKNATLAKLELANSVER